MLLPDGVYDIDGEWATTRKRIPSLSVAPGEEITLRDDGRSVTGTPIAFSLAKDPAIHDNQLRPRQTHRGTLGAHSGKSLSAPICQGFSGSDNAFDPSAPQYPRRKREVQPHLRGIELHRLLGIKRTR